MLLCGLSHSSLQHSSILTSGKRWTYIFSDNYYFLYLYTYDRPQLNEGQDQGAPTIPVLDSWAIIILFCSHFFSILYKKTLIFKLELTSSKFYIIVLPLFLVCLKTCVAKPMHLQINNLSLIHIKITKIYSLSANVSKEKCFHYWQQRIVVFVSVANTKININNSRNIH